MKTRSIGFKILDKDEHSGARAGVISTTHGDIATPAFIPVATQGSVKSLDPDDLRALGVEVVLANTYHLHLRPGEELVKKFGDLSKFMNWNGPMMTDSGGFQVFSLGVALEQGVRKLFHEDESPQKPRLNKIAEEGVYFQSHIDGSAHFLSPEKSIEIQERLGVDLVVAFDDLESPKYSYGETLASLELTERWLARSKKAHKRDDQLLYGVTHGGKFEDLRIKSAQFVDRHFDAVALGGTHSSKQNMYDVVRWTVEYTCEEKPKHMLGVGEIDDIFQIVALGIDTFDCVIPTRLARMGWFFVFPPQGSVKNRFREDILKAHNKASFEPLSRECSCYVCQSYSRAYIYHLFKARELLAYSLLTYHNIAFYTELMRRIRTHITDGRFLQLKESWLS